ncbi:HNH endonuclease signature motif containing protein [Microbacterium sp. A93]|uniref:HNH endonuclease signature motif containing protein n=1 Tax=Microbacterium sp. A93 TaxID=3450716 RepID=UPI003F424AAE
MEDGGLREPLLGIPGGARPFRDAPDWMVRTLRIARPEARRRIQRAQQTQPPPPELSGHQRSADYPVLAESFLRGTIDPASLDLITRALQDTRKDAEASGAEAGLTEKWLRQGEEMLTGQACVLDAESMRHACARWRQWAQHSLNPDGSEPSEALPNLQQGLSYQGKRRRFHQWRIMADDLQHEVLSTIAGAATNPRSKSAKSTTGSEDSEDSEDSTVARDGQAVGPDQPNGPEVPAESAEPAESGDSAEPTELDDHRDPTHLWGSAAELATDPRTRHQRQLDGLTSALMGALSLTNGNGLPDSGGGRPLVMVSIDYQTLTDQWMAGPACENARSAPPDPPGPPDPPDRPDGPDTPNAPDVPDPSEPPEPSGPQAPTGTAERIPFDLGNFRSEAVFTGPISPVTIRALACDADLLPVVLGGAGQVLDVGRSQRLFPARLRKAVTARDGGCAAPGCTMPAPWTEVHHVQWWIRGGPTSVDNGVLLCNRHHLAVHGGSWDIILEDGIPWFVPAPFIDPFRKPLRNHYWRS